MPWALGSLMLACAPAQAQKTLGVAAFPAVDKIVEAAIPLLVLSSRQLISGLTPGAVE